MENNEVIKYEGELLKQINNSIRITNKLLAFRMIRIVHLDDHKIFNDGFKRVIEPLFRNIKIFHFQHSDPALKFIEENISNKDVIDLVVTDFKHYGLDGYQFTKKIRMLEDVYLIKIPVLLLTMWVELPEIQQGIDENIYDKYFSKSVSKEELGEYIKSIV